MRCAKQHEKFQSLTDIKNSVVRCYAASNRRSYDTHILLRKDRYNDARNVQNDHSHMPRSRCIAYACMNDLSESMDFEEWPDLSFLQKEPSQQQHRCSTMANARAADALHCACVHARAFLATSSRRCAWGEKWPGMKIIPQDPQKSRETASLHGS